ncbi:MAG: response regulator [Hymenobacteraceae bacterium]|nr:response regulator [Hymenobacteraceae bacterium]MDX5395681.1 response regulator [Hymenobacteraceae bacterium]MDX5511735.1 response regulator [Hymenobacteraceae bacterium]
MADLLKLLVIDDDAVDRMAIMRSVKNSNLSATIEIAESGEDGKSKIESGRYDCIFIDFKLPDIDGLQLLQHIRQKGIQTPVLIVTSHGDERIAADAIKLGASDYIPKTLLSPEGISLSVRSAIRLHDLVKARSKAEQNLRNTQAQLEAVLVSAPVAMWSIDAAGIITFAKGKGFELIGIKPGSIIGFSIFDVFAPYPKINDHIKEALLGKAVKVINRVEGVCFESHYVPLYNNDNQLRGVTGVAFDITDRIKTEEELKAAKEVAEQSVKIKERFLANMSHEIRTPMNGIIGLSKVLQKSTLNAEQQKYLKAIQTSADNLLVIINDLLDISKIEADKIHFEEVEFNILDLIQDTVNLLEPKAQDKNNTLKAFTDARVPALLVGDPGKLRQVLINLLGNACKFTKDGTITLTTERLSDSSGHVILEFEVKDNGIGIAPEKLELIFDSFTQASSDTTRKFGGTGLGLTISKKLVEMQGGAINVSSEPGVGSIFTFTLAFKKSEGQGKANLAEETQALDPVKLGSLKVLLAEDNQINQLLVDKIITDWGFSLDIAENGKVALEMAAKKPYDLILMDMQMPEMDGYEAIQQLRQMQNKLATIPVIALTAHATKGEIDKCLNAGANAFLSKPFDPDDLLLEISGLFQKKSLKTAGNPTESEKTYINLAALLEIAGEDKSFLAEILSMLVEQIPAEMQKLHKSSEAANWQAVKTQAQHLQTGISQIGATELEKLLAEIEAAVSENMDAENLNKLIHQAQQLCRQIMDELKSELKKL